MKTLGLIVFGLCTVVVGSTKAAQESHNLRSEAEIKQVLTTLPDSTEPVRLTALTIDRGWTTSMIHLQGNVRVDMRQSSRSGYHLIVVRANEADYNEKTGELTPRGNVRITQEAFK